MAGGRLPDWNHITKALRLRVVGPVVRARGAVLRRLRPAPPPKPNLALDRRPILVIGCHRSGTSLLRRCLDSHSRIACPGETLFLEYLGAAVGAPKADKGFAALGLELDVVTDELRTRVVAWFEAYARSRGKPRWADKSPGTANHLEGVDRLLGHTPTYLHLVRDGMDVAQSIGSARPIWWQIEPFLRFEPDPYVASAHYWVDLNQKLLAFVRAHPDRCHLLRYEELIASPERVLRTALAFAGEAWEPEVLDFNKAEHTGGPEDVHVKSTTTFEDNTGKHRKLPIEVQRRMWAVVRETMLELGYADRTYA